MWDFRISLTELCTSSVVDPYFLESVMATPPAKILLAGADCIIPANFRGGVAPKRKGGELEREESEKAKKTRPHELPTPTTSVDTLGDLDKGYRISSSGVLSITAADRSDDMYRGIYVNESPAEVDSSFVRAPDELIESQAEHDYVKSDGQKADDAGVNTGLWDGFFEEEYVAEVGALPTSEDALLRSEGKIDGYRKALNGFRRFAVRKYRRNLLKGFVKWRRKHLPLAVEEKKPDSSRRPNAFMYVKVDAEASQVSGHAVYVWTRTGRDEYEAARRKLMAKRDGPNSLKMAADGIARASGPYCRDAEEYVSFQDGDEFLHAWWEWTSGSTPFFWNWPEKYQADAREGQPHFTTGDPQPFRRPQNGPDSTETAELVRDKVLPVRLKEYIERGDVNSLLHYFWVPKGDSDIRMVYDGSGCGLNDIIWAAHFGLPTVRNTARALLPGYYQCDMDVGEMFLNFILHERLRQLSGVDIRHVRSVDDNDEEWEATRNQSWERWCRNWMGLRDSPFRSIQMMTRLRYEAYGDRREVLNPFHYEHVIFNLPGCDSYRPDLPWVMKARWDGHLASEVFVYVDDGRATGHCRQICWKAICKFASTCSRYGIQDAGRKRTGPSMSPGPWAGTVCLTVDGDVVGTLSAKKWEKTKALVNELKSMVEEAGHNGVVSRDRLLSIRGFLIYVVRTYPYINPYLKGLHNTIDGFRDDRGEGGWKMTGPRLRDMLAARRENDSELEELEAAADITVPECVKVQPRLFSDVRALVKLTEPVDPPRESMRSNKPLFGFLPGDASGSGFGAALIQDQRILYFSGAWAGKWRNESSNFRESSNLVIRLKELIDEGVIRDQELFVFTDNFTFESCYYKGHSTNELLTDLILELYLAAQAGNVKLHVIWVAGSRMKAWGIDGLSRGDTTEGLMAGEDPVSFVPLALDANERSGGKVLRWIESFLRETGGVLESEPDRWWGGVPPVLITKDNMFELNKVSGTRIWIFPPAAMETVIECFNEDRVAHPENAHVFAIPRLMTHLWQKNLNKDADVLFPVEAGPQPGHFWATNQHEPLIVAIVFPFAYVDRYQGPWVARGLDDVRHFGEELRQGFLFASGKSRRPDQLSVMDGELRRVWETPVRRSRTVLQELLSWARGFPPVRECMVRS